METTVQKWGNSLGVRLPKPVAQAAGVKAGSRVSVEARDGRVVVTPLREPAYRLDQLVRGITPRNRPKVAE
jgi:antitoxin MazE